jgi:protein ImuB
LKNWPIDRLRRRCKALRHKPLVLVETIAGRQVVAAVSDEARPAGIRSGMTLTEARALCRSVIHVEHDPARDAQGLEALGRYMQRFTPIVAFAPESLSRATGLFLDLTGCDRLFGGLKKLVQQIRQSLNDFQIAANLAVAPTPGAAWALAAQGKQLPIENCQLSIGNLIASLPPAALRIDPDTSAALNHLGIETIAQLMSLPRESLPSRFGPALLLRLDQALGRIPEPLTPLPHHNPIADGIDFEAPIDSLETIWLAFKNLLGQVVNELIGRGCGARKLHVQFIRPYASPLQKTIELSRPSRNPLKLFNLLRCALEELETDEGFIGLRLSVPLFERLSEEQSLLLAQEEIANRHELDHLIERLIARLGKEGLVRPEMVESHIPELAWHGFSTRFGGCMKKARAENKALTLPSVSTATLRPGVPGEGEKARPLQLLPRPAEIRVMVAPSDDRDGRPVMFSHARQVHRIVHAVGPERICGQWWQGRNKTRDYFDVEDPEGRRFWIFRVCETSRWFLHGLNH